MYLDILHRTIGHHIDEQNASKNKKPIIIKLTPILYESIQGELNTAFKRNTDLPITQVKYTEFMVYDRTITIELNTALDIHFERELVTELAKCYAPK
jgi:hypothetical protein